MPCVYPYSIYMNGFYRYMECLKTFPWNQLIEVILLVVNNAIFVRFSYFQRNVQEKCFVKEVARGKGAWPALDG